MRQRKCKKNYKDVGVPITTNMVCGGFGGDSAENTCNTDSGGPVVCSTSSGRWILQGVVSFGAGGCHPGYYSVNARVGRYTSWINSHISASGNTLQFLLLKRFLKPVSALLTKTRNHFGLYLQCLYETVNTMTIFSKPIKQNCHNSLKPQAHRMKYRFPRKKGEWRHFP